MKKTLNITNVILVIILLFVIAYVAYGRLAPKYTGTSAGVSSGSSASDNAAVDFEVMDADGNIVALHDYLEKPTIINFWASWCGPCKSELPAFDKLYKEYGDGVNFMMVNLTDGSRDTVDGVKEFVDSKGYSFPVYYDTQGSASNAYGIYSIPMTIVINSEGQIVGEQTGAMNEDTLKEYLEKIK